MTTLTHARPAERSYLLSQSITMDTFVDDIVGHLTWENLENIVPIGHRFGGAPINGAADRVPERIKMLVYLDVALMENGETWFGLLHTEIVASRKGAAEEATAGMSLTIGPVESFDVEKPSDVAFLEGRRTPHPLATFSTPLRPNGPCGNGLPGLLHHLHRSCLRAGQAWPGPGTRQRLAD